MLLTLFLLVSTAFSSKMCDSSPESAEFSVAAGAGEAAVGVEIRLVGFSQASFVSTNVTGGMMFTGPATLSPVTEIRGKAGAAADTKFSWYTLYEVTGDASLADAQITVDFAGHCVKDTCVISCTHAGALNPAGNRKSVKADVDRSTSPIVFTFTAV